MMADFHAAYARGFYRFDSKPSKVLARIATHLRAVLPNAALATNARDTRAMIDAIEAIFAERIQQPINREPC